MGPVENKQLVQRVFAELERGNPRPFVDSFADDVRWTVMGTTPWSRIYDGKAAVLSDLLGPLRERLVHSVRVTPTRILADEDCVVVEARGEATTKGGRPYNNTYCWIFRLDAGKILEITEHLDTELAATVLGARGEENLTQAVPFFMVTDIAASARFYVEGLGFEMTHRWIDGGQLRWCWLCRGGAAVMLQQFWNEGPHASAPAGRLGEGVSTFFLCDDAIAFYREVVERHVAAKRPFVGNSMWVTAIADPDGYQLLFESPTDAPEETEWDSRSVRL
jgi:ketosteroid isomerase-like protein/catechol 2,3-dioxygenase-like lactoylglutathione lyase family enzyme